METKKLFHFSCLVMVVGGGYLLFFGGGVFELTLKITKLKFNGITLLNKM